MAFIGTVVKVAVGVGVNYYQGQKQKKAQSAASAAQKKAQKKAKKEKYYLDRRARREARKQEDIKNPFSVTLQIQDSTAPRRLCFGRCRVGGILMFIESAGGDNDLLYRTFGWGEGPCQEIENIYLDEDIPTLDANGTGTGEYLHDIQVRNFTAGLFDSTEQTFTVDTVANSIIFSDQMVPAAAAGDMITVRSETTLPAGMGGIQQFWLLAEVGTLEWTISSKLYHLDLTYGDPAYAVTITDTGTGTHYVTRRVTDSMSCNATQNWKPDQHKLLGISHSVVLLSAGAVSGGQFTSVPEISALGQWKRDILDPRTIFTVDPADINTSSNWITTGSHGYSGGEVVAAYGTKNSDGLVSGGLTYGQKYYIIYNSATKFRLTTKYGEDALTLTSLDTGDLVLVKGHYSNNAALCLANYLADPVKGPNVDWYAGINQTQLGLAADTCDEAVEILDSQTAAGTFVPADWTLTGYTITITDHGFEHKQLVKLTTTDTLPTGLSVGESYAVLVVDDDTFQLADDPNGIRLVISDGGVGTHTIYKWDKRYPCDGAVDMSESPDGVIEMFKLAMGSGDVVYSQGQFFIYAGEYSAPTFNITPDMIVGPIKRTKVSSRSERINEVSARYYAEVNKWQPDVAPIVDSAAYKLEDKETLRENIELPLTKSPAAAQRIAKIVMEESRMMDSLEFTCNLRAYPALTARNVTVTIPKYSMSEKIFRVEKMELSGDVGSIDIAFKLIEWSPDIYDWSYSTDEQVINEAASIVNPGKKCQDVVASPAGGGGNSFPMTSAVTLSSATAGATIRYNVGTGVTAPQLDSEGTLYSAAITVTTDGDNIAAKAFRANYQASDDMDETYTT